MVTVLKDGKPALEKVGQTSNLKERSERARQFAEVMKLSIPVLVDKSDDKVNEAYAGWPERLYVVGTDGKIAYKGGAGPIGFKIAEVRDWLDRKAK